MIVKKSIINNLIKKRINKNKYEEFLKRPK